MRRGIGALACLLVVACATSEKQDERGGSIGEPCSNNEDCASGLCIFVEAGGLCTDFCPPNECPSGWDCYTTTDVGEPGEVDSICVPVDEQLCRSCETDTDCSLAGDDHCLEGKNGKTFCGRDCSAVGCPQGYTCQVVEVDGVDREQCIPVTNSCDCGPAEMDDTEDCTIETFAGDCIGIRTCTGPTGWSDCLPPSNVDVPDPEFGDDNCDGIDGDLSRSVLVSPMGSDENGCGLSTTLPCNTINFAIDQALASGRDHVLAQAGLYTEVVRMADGVSIAGGYDQDWQRALFTETGHRVELFGAQDPTTLLFATVIAHDITLETTLSDVVITGPGATGVNGDSGRSSYAVHARNSENLRIERVSITAGNGAAGPNGGNGLNASITGRLSAMNGRSGGASDEFISSCNTTSHGLGGARGLNTCEGGIDPDAGSGGNGGEMDTSCGFFGCSNCNATPGDSGFNARHVSGSFGRGGAGGTGGGSCGTPGNGSSGRIANGIRGAGAATGGFVFGSSWHSNGGGSGGLGAHGGGGGGGGGSGGCDDGTDSYGAGGGGGGAGGCRARTAAEGGWGGGGSFGIMSIDTTVTISGCTIIRGNGGNGGNGGIGGRGQSGGLSGNGGTSTNDSAPGGRGGAGAHGGHGGGGGGGAGGPSAAIAHQNSTVTSDCLASGGSGGSGGAGGLSAPTAPVSERDGNDGTAGAPGGVFGELSL